MSVHTAVEGSANGVVSGYTYSPYCLSEFTQFEHVERKSTDE